VTATESQAAVPGQAAPSQSRAVAERYLAAWNAHDGSAVAALVRGTYYDPTLPGPIAGDDLAAYVDGLCAAFPDLHFEHDGEPVVEGDRVVSPWRMRGTNNGAPLPGAPAPTDGTIDLAGIDVITVEGDRVATVQGYFDQKTFVEQLGLQAIVAPADTWPVSFGLAARVDLGNTTTPGALSMTWIDVDPDEQGELVERTQAILGALAAEPGFIAFQSTKIGRRNLTLTAWTSPEAAEAAIARAAPHTSAMDRIWQGGFGSRGFTGFWAPYRLNSQFARCGDCQSYVQIDAGETSKTCACGTELAVEPYL